MAFKFELSTVDVDTISRALGKQSYDEVAGVVQRMQVQISAQNIAARQAADKAKRDEIESNVRTEIAAQGPGKTKIIRAKKVANGSQAKAAAAVSA